MLDVHRGSAPPPSTIHQLRPNAPARLCNRGGAEIGSVHDPVLRVYTSGATPGATWCSEAAG